MKPFTLFVFTVALLFAFSCNRADSNSNEKIERVSMTHSEVFEYKTGISGDEESAAITLQPRHSEISEMVRDSTTNWESVYRYQPEEGFEGTDQAEIKLGTGSDGAGPNTHFEVIRFEFTVN